MSTEPKIKYPYRFVNPQSEYPDNRDIFIVIHVRSMLQWTKILSAGLEGAYLLYPDDHHDVSVPLMEFIMSCDSIADCLLNNPVFRDSLAGVVRDIIANESLTSSDNSYSDTDGDEVVTNDLDAVYGGSKEVVEYWLDLLKTICFFIQGINDFIDLGEQVYNRSLNRRYGETPYLEGGTQKQLGQGVNAIEIAGGGLRQIPQIILQLTGAISQATFVGVMSDVANVGTNLILADINDERLEALSCVLFDEITCNGNVRKDPPYVMSSSVIQNVMSRYLTDPNGGIAGFALGVLGNITTQTGDIFTIFPIGESLREYSSGTRSPSSEWLDNCLDCGGQPSSWTFTFNFLIQPYLDYWTNQNVPQTTQATSWTAQGWGGGREFDGARTREVARIQSAFNVAVITEISITTVATGGVGGSFFANNMVVQSLLNGVWTTRNTISPLYTSAGTRTDTFTYGGLNAEGLRFSPSGYQRVGNIDPQGDTRITSITIKGTGTNPFI